jgi:hypothetical protein
MAQKVILWRIREAVTGSILFTVMAEIKHSLKSLVDTDPKQSFFYSDDRR